MFDGICILIALYLYTKVWRNYQSIAFTVLCFFVVSDVTYNYLFKDFRGSNNWLIYQLYSAINIAVIYKLRQLNAHLFIIGLIVSNTLVNVVTSFYFISQAVSPSVYNLYPYFAGAISILCLIYLRMLGNGVRYLNSNINNQGAVSVLFRRSNGGLF